MADWTQPFEASYRFMRVSRRTGLEVSRIGNVLDGGTIDRNLNTTCKESGSISCVGSLDIGPDLLRVYMDATFDDGTEASEPLGTFLASSDSRETDGSSSVASVSLIGRLAELEQSDFMQPFSVSPGANLVSIAMGIVEDAGLACSADQSAATATERLYYGISKSGDEAAAEGSKLAVVNDLLDRAGFDSARTDPMGRVIMRRSSAIDGRPVAWSFIEGANARFLRKAGDEAKTSEVKNVARAVFDGEGGTVVGIARDDSGGPWSVDTIGRELVRTERYQADATQDEADAKAAELLADSQNPIRKVKLSHVYAPVAVSDAVEVDYRSGGIKARSAVRTMRLALVGGCLTETELRSYVR